MDEQLELETAHVETAKERAIKFLVVTMVGYVASQTAEHIVEKVFASRRAQL